MCALAQMQHEVDTLRFGGGAVIIQQPMTVAAQPMVMAQPMAIAQPVVVAQQTAVVQPQKNHTD